MAEDDKTPEEIAIEEAKAAFEAAMPPPGPKFAARITDMHICPMVDGVKPHVGGPVTVGEPTVMIGFQPAARVGDMVTCVGPPDSIAVGSMTVMIGNMPAARVMDQTVHGGMISTGFPTVIIGDMCPGASGAGTPGTGRLAAPPGGECLEAASKSAIPFVDM